ncbi:MAG: hypothetical protein JW940_37715 [Polyangiaceae bacterium]|nr:hypothetical protein [Polyangiaceae bacterium]
MDLVSPLLALLGTACAAAMPAEPPARQTNTTVATAAPRPEAKPAQRETDPAKQAATLASGEADEQPADTDENEPAQTADLIPSGCATPGAVCLPPAEFAARVCAGKNPDVAVYMMQKGQPWTHGYIRVENVDTVNTLGGPTGEAKLAFGEEVLVLRGRTEKTGGVQVSGTGGFIVLRWDGTCATLAEHELVTWVPGLPRHAPLTWKYLGAGVQQALLESRRVREARKQHRDQCQGATFGRSPECLKATERLNEAIVVAVRTGTKVPFPERVR